MTAAAALREVSLPEAMAIGVRLQREGRLDDAEEVYRRVLEVAPDYADALHYSGLLAHQRGRSEQAVALMERSLQLQPLQADWYSNVAIVHMHGGRVEQALSACRHAIALDPNHARAHGNLGVLLRAQGDPAAAEESYRTALRLNPEHIDTYHNLGLLLSAQKRGREALECFCRAITLSPRHPDSRRLLAQAHCTLGEVDKAAQVFTQWLDEEPDNPIARHMVAATTNRDVPGRASDAYVEAVFDSFAASFESRLERLGYRAPSLVAAAVAAGASPKSLDVLDAGCGTGLCGPLLAPFARRLVGVDLSAGMLARASEKAVYDELVKDELSTYLSGHAGAFDVVVSADTLVYFGALDAVAAAAAAALRPGGRFVFTVEDLAGTDVAEPFTIRHHGRYAHAREYVERVLADAGFDPAIEQAELRMEGGEPVRGLVVCAVNAPDRRPPVATSMAAAEAVGPGRRHG